MLFRNTMHDVNTNKNSIQVRELYVKSILSKSGLYSIDYSINPYLGCQHGCVYCYARFMKRFADTDRQWGHFVFVKVNAPKILSKEIKKIPPKSSILLSSVCDPYQPIEKYYNITRSLLEILIKNDKHKIFILTKSNLVERDLDIIKKFKDIEVGISLSHLSNTVQEIFEPNASSPSKRIEALSNMAQEKIPTYIFIAPVLPKITDKYVKRILEKAAELNVKYAFFDTLNLKAGNWKYIINAVKSYDSKLEDTYTEIFFNKSSWLKYYLFFKKHALQLCESLNLDCIFTF